MKQNPCTCKCGCGETFYPSTVYIRKDGSSKDLPSKYKRGHHPNCRKTQTNNKPAWNKGLKKGDHPSIERMGFQKDHQPHNDWSRVNERLRTDPSLREQWITAKRKQVPWNKGITKEGYKKGFASGKDHGNWKGGKRGIYDTAELKTFSKSILKRDKYTCQECGDKNRKGRGSRINLEVHHIIAIKEDHNLALDPNNAITLCKTCHIKTGNYGTKLVHKLRNQSSK